MRFRRTRECRSFQTEYEVVTGYPVRRSVAEALLADGWTTERLYSLIGVGQFAAAHGAWVATVSGDWTRVSPRYATEGLALASTAATRRGMPFEAAMTWCVVLAEETRKPFAHSLFLALRDGQDQTGTHPVTWDMILPLGACGPLAVLAGFSLEEAVRQHAAGTLDADALRVLIALRDSAPVDVPA